MRKNESIKRLIILCLSFLGILLSTGIYAYTWIEKYHQRYVRQQLYICRKSLRLRRITKIPDAEL